MLITGSTGARSRKESDRWMAVKRRTHCFVLREAGYITPWLMLGLGTVGLSLTLQRWNPAFRGRGQQVGVRVQSFESIRRTAVRDVLNCKMKRGQSLRDGDICKLVLGETLRTYRDA